MIRLILLLLSVFGGTTLLSAEECPPCNTEIGLDSILLRGIAIVSAGGDLQTVPRNEGIYTNVPDVDLQGIDTALTSYLNSYLSDEKIQKIKNSVIEFCHQRKILLTVIVPEQDVTDGIMIIEVLISKVGDIVFSEQKWFSRWIFEKNISLKSGDILDQNALLNDLAFLNSNLSHKTDVFLSPGDEPGLTDLEFITKDRFPWHFYVGGDSTGVQIVDRIRLYGGFRWDDAFQIGDVLSYQYTASPDFHEFQSHAVSYISNLPTQDLLTLLAIYGQVYPVIPDFRTEGSAAQASVIYNLLVKPLYHTWTQEVAFGLTYKYLNSNLFFIGNTLELPLIEGKINITELQLGYYLSNVEGNHEFSLDLQALISPWKQLLPHQTNHAYNVLRPGSSPIFAYFQSSLGYRYQIWKECAVSALLNGQVATGALPSSEQYSLGGMTSVRGYEQSQDLADNAICGNFELSFPPGFSFISPAKDRGFLLIFCDLAYGANYQMDSSEFEHLFLGGVGPGFRYSIPPYFSLRADYGIRLDKIPGGSALGRFYLSATLGY